MRKHLSPVPEYAQLKALMQYSQVLMRQNVIEISTDTCWKLHLFVCENDTGYSIFAPIDMLGR